MVATESNPIREQNAQVRPIPLLSEVVVRKVMPMDAGATKRPAAGLLRDRPSSKKLLESPSVNSPYQCAASWTHGRSPLRFCRDLAPGFRTLVSRKCIGAPFRGNCIAVIVFEQHADAFAVARALCSRVQGRHRVQPGRSDSHREAHAKARRFLHAG